MIRLKPTHYHRKRLFKINTADKHQYRRLSLLTEIASTVLPSCGWYKVLHIRNGLNKTTYFPEKCIYFENQFDRN